LKKARYNRIVQVRVDCSKVRRYFFQKESKTYRNLNKLIYLPQNKTGCKI